jgi:glycosyltransferase involved in cell wall biosynthesis
MSIKVLQVVVSKNVKGEKASVTGPERRAANLAHQWKDFDIEPIICYPSKGSLHSYFNDAGLKVIDFELKGKFDISAVGQLKKIIKEHGINLVHSQGAAALDLIVTLAAKQAGVPVVVTRPVMICDQIHYSKIKRRVYEIIDRNITMKLLDSVVAVSHLGASILKNRYKVNPKKIKVIHNGVDLNKFYPKKHTNIIDESQDIVTIGMMAHLSPFKGWYDFIKTINIIQRKSTKKIKALIIGDGVMRKELEEEVVRLELSNIIKFTGYVDNVKELLNKLDIFLFTTHREGLSVAVLETLSTALPIVATDIGGIKEQIDIDKNGYILPKGDIEGMAQKCLKLIEDKELRIKMGKKSREIAEQRFSEKRMLQEHVDCYQSVL